MLADTVCAGCKNRWVDFKLYWATGLKAVTIPMVVKELTSGSFWVNPPFDYEPMRAVEQGVEWKWPVPGWAGTIQEVRPVEGCATPGNAYDGVSPDNFVIAAQGSNPLPPQDTGWVCVTLKFDVTNVHGRFLFDTTCATVNLKRIFMIDENDVDHGPDVTFKPGVVTIADCNCMRYCDVNLDGSINPVDVVIMVNWVYRTKDSRKQISTCPGNNGDWNCDGQTNPVDVVRYVNFVYKGQTQFPPCNPCACTVYPPQHSGDCPPWP